MVARRFGVVGMSLALAFLLGCVTETPIEDTPVNSAPAGSGGAAGGSSSPSSAGSGSGRGGSNAGADAGVGSDGDPSEQDSPSVSRDTTTRPSGGVSGDDCNAPIDEERWADEVLRLVNRERRNAGLPAVTENSTLAEQAAAYACELIAFDYFDHVNPFTGEDLGSRTDRFGYDYSLVGENLAAGQRSPAEAVQAWMDSPGHRENILNPEFVHLGVGIRVGGDYGYYWVQEFGKPRR